MNTFIQNYQYITNESTLNVDGDYDFKTNIIEMEKYRIEDEEYYYFPLIVSVEIKNKKYNAFLLHKTTIIEQKNIYPKMAKWITCKKIKGNNMSFLFYGSANDILKLKLSI